MAANRSPSPRVLSPEIPVVSYPTPNVEDLIVVQDVDTRVPGYAPLEYGDPHPDPVNYPGLKLVSQAPLDQENNYMWVRRIYARDRRDEDAYNFALKYSASDPEYPIYIRTYAVLRADYVPLPAGSPDPVLPSATLILEEVTRFKGDAEDATLDSLYVKVMRVFETLPGPVITRYETNELGQTVEVSSQRKFYGDDYLPPTADALTSFSSEIGEGNVITDTVKTLPEVFAGKLYSKEASDPAPQKFRVAVPAVTEEETVEGVAEEPVLLTGEFAKSEQQQTKFTKRKRKTSRSALALPKTLTQKSTNEVKQLATVTETLQTSDTTETPTATKNVESEALGDGTYVVRKTEVPEVFDAKVFSKEVPDPVPTKFRVAVPALTEEETVTGDAAEPTLTTGELSKSEQQQTKFTKRKRKTARNRASLPKTLTQKSTNEVKQLASVTETLQEEDTSDAPTATKDIESEALGDGTYVVRKTEVPEVFDALVISKERSDPVPQKFRVAVPSVTTEETVEGVVEEPVLGGGELSKSEQQQTKFTKRRRRTARSYAGSGGLPKTLTQKLTTEQKQLATVTEIFQQGDTTILPTATLDVESDALGDGTYLVKTTEVPTLFAAKAFSAERPDPVPQKFRVAVPLTSNEETVVGQATQPTLSTGQISQSEQQVNQFAKRVAKSYRNVQNSVSLSESVLTPEGQKGTRTLTLSAGAQSFTPSATLIEADVEALGDGRTVKTEVTVGSVFDGKQVSASKPDVIPEQFRASVPTQTTVRTEAKSSVSMPVLGAGDLEKSEVRVSATKARISETTRDTSSFPDLRGQDYDASVDVVIPFSERITPSGQSLSNENTFVDPLSDEFDLVREIDVEAAKAKLKELLLQFPTRANLSLPPVLKSVKVVWDCVSEEGEFDTDWNGYSEGQSWSLSGDETGDCESTATLTPSFQTEIDEVWGNNVPTTSYFFFLPYPVTLGDILSKVEADKWPVFKPKALNLSAVGQSKTIKLTVSAQGSSSGSDTTYSRSKTSSWKRNFRVANNTVNLSIPATLHGAVSVEQEGPTQKTVNASVNVGWVGNNFPTIIISQQGSATVEGTLNAGITGTSPSDIPRSGRYLIDSRVELYQYGLAKVYAEVLDASVFA